MTPIGSVEPKLLSNLGLDAAVNIFRQLLWAEAAEVGLGPSLISVPSAITAADGGVDAEINAPIPVEHDLLISGTTRYQIKTGAFSAGNKFELKALLLNSGRTDFHARVRSCLEKKGAFVAVVFGADPAESYGQLFVGRVDGAGECALRLKNRAPEASAGVRGRTERSRVAAPIYS